MRHQWRWIRGEKNSKTPNARIWNPNLCHLHKLIKYCAFFLYPLRIVLYWRREWGGYITKMWYSLLKPAGPTWLGEGNGVSSISADGRRDVIQNIWFQFRLFTGPFSKNFASPFAHQTVRWFKNRCANPCLKKISHIVWWGRMTPITLCCWTQTEFLGVGVASSVFEGVGELL